MLVVATRVAVADPTDTADRGDDGGDGSAAGSGEVIEVSGRAPHEPEQAKVAPEELHALPGGGNDALRGLTSLPGVARIPYGLGGLALRGAAPHDTRVFLDGIEVPILYHFGGLASFVPIDMLDHVELTPSGFGARWGRGIGGVVVLDSHSPHVTHWMTEAEVSLLHAGALAVGPGSNGSQWLVGVRRSYVDLVLAAAQVDFSVAPSYTDAQLRWESHDRHWLALAFASDDGLDFVHDPSSGGGGGGISTSSVKSFNYTSRFVRTGLRYRDGGTIVTPWLGANDIVAVANHKGVDKGYTRRDYVAGLRVDHERPLYGGILRTGFDGRATDYNYGITDIPPPGPGMPPQNLVITRNGEKSAVDTGVFVEEEWALADGHVVLRPGLRIDYFGLADQVVIDPRFAVVERTNDGVVLTETLGLYHEPPLVTDLDPIFGDRTLAPPTSIQTSVSAETTFGELFDGKATAYVQVQSQLPVDVVTGATPISDNGGAQAGGLLGISRELVDEQFGSYSYREYIGEGRAAGLELSARRDVGRFTGWLGYTYARALRTGDPRSDPHYYPYVLDQPHVFTAVATTMIGSSWRVGGRFRFATGNPITPVAAAYFDPAKMEWTAVDGPILSQRLPDFAQLDLRIDHLWRKPHGTWDLYLDVQNVTNASNPEGVTYSNDFMTRHYTTGLPVFPSLGIEYRPLQ